MEIKEIIDLFLSEYKIRKTILKENKSIKDNYIYLYELINKYNIFNDKSDALLLELKDNERELLYKLDDYIEIFLREDLKKELVDYDFINDIKCNKIEIEWLDISNYYEKIFKLVVDKNLSFKIEFVKEELKEVIKNRIDLISENDVVINVINEIWENKSYLENLKKIRSYDIPISLNDLKLYIKKNLIIFEINDLTYTININELDNDLTYTININELDNDLLNKLKIPISAVPEFIFYEDYIDYMYRSIGKDNHNADIIEEKSDYNLKDGFLNLIVESKTKITKVLNSELSEIYINNVMELGQKYIEELYNKPEEKFILQGKYISLLVDLENKLLEKNKNYEKEKEKIKTLNKFKNIIQENK